jgi:hypothetical protein
MAPLTQTQTFTASQPPNEVHDRVLGWFAKYRPRVEVDSADSLEINTGSQLKMRLIGGAFIAGSSLPTHTTVTMTAAGSGTQVSVTARDTVGVGFKLGMKRKYETWLSQIATGIQAACGGPAA